MVAGLGRAAGARDEPLELINVELAWLDPQHVAARLAQQPIVAEQLPEPIEVGVQ